MATGVARRAVGMHRLWKNPAQGSSFSAQTIYIPVSNYDALLFFTSAYGNGQLYSTIGIVPKHTAWYPVTINLEYMQIPLDTYQDQSSLGDVLQGVHRFVDIYEGAVLFHHGQMLYSNRYYKDWDNRAIPNQIWGIIF